MINLRCLPPYRINPSDDYFDSELQMHVGWTTRHTEAIGTVDDALALAASMEQKTEEPTKEKDK